MTAAPSARPNDPVFCRFRAEWAALAVLVLVKLALLAWFGPASEPDWHDYSSFADLILTSPSWWTDAALASAPSPLTLFRSIGYPLAVAGFRAVLGAGPASLLALILFQMALSLAATVLVWRLALRLLRSRPLALLAAAGHATALTLIYDQSLLSDSLYNSLFILCWALPLLSALERRPARPLVLFGLGALFAFTCLQRGTGLPFLALVLPGLVWWVKTSARRFVPAILLVALFLAPVAATVGADMAWNHGRTGHWLMTTGAQQVMIQPLVKAEGRGHVMFDGDTPLDRVARAELKTFEFTEVGRIVARLFTDYGQDSITQARTQTAVYFRSWLRHPWPMLENTINNYNGSIIQQFFDPIDSANYYSLIVTGKKQLPSFSAAWKLIREGGVAAPFVALLMAAASLLRVAAYGAFITLLVGGPALVARRWSRPLTEEETVVLGLWTLYFAYTVSLCAIHMVGRFVPAALPAGLIGALFLAQAGLAALRARRAHHG